MPEKPVTVSKCIAEIVGTFGLVFAGTCTIVVHQQTHEAGLVGIALAFGLVIMAMIYAIGPCSGAHMNPAVSIGLCAAGRFAPVALVPYIICQIIGAFIASFLVSQLFPELVPMGLGTTMVSGTIKQSFLLEVILTFFLVFVILSVTSGPKETGILAGLAIGGTIILDILAGGPISGASMNPARSLAPAVVSHHLDNLWLYMVAPVLGALIAVPIHLLTRRPASA